MATTSLHGRATRWMAVPLASGLLLGACVTDEGTVTVDETASEQDVTSTDDPSPDESAGPSTEPTRGTASATDATDATDAPTPDATGTATAGSTAGPTTQPSQQATSTAPTPNASATPAPTQSQSATPRPTVTTSGATNRPPSATTDSVRTDEGVGVWFRPLDNDSDPDGDGLTVTSITQPRNGTASEIDNEIFYRPDAGFSGYDSLTYQVSDGRGGTDSGVAQIFVVANEPPSAVDDRASTEEGVAVTVDVLANDSDPEGGPLTVASYTQPGGGSVSRSGDDLRFVPTAGYTGTTTFTYTVEDDQGQTDSASVTVTVTASNGPPSAANDAATVQYGGSVFVNLVANDSDPDGDSLTYQIMSSPTYGTVSSVDAQTVQYTHVPGRSFSGTDSFTYRAVDPDGAVSNTATVTITINRAPIATNDTVTTYNDVVSFNVITGSGTDAGTGNADYDPDGDALQITPISMTFSSGTGGTLTCGSNGACTWDPNPSCSGAYETISYTLRDARGGADTATLELSAYLIC